MKTMIILLALACAGCSEAKSGAAFHGLDYYLDPATGCQYVAKGGVGYTSITPRMGADGKQICGARP